MVADARLGLATNIFTYCFGVIPQRKLLVFTTPVTSFYICNRDLLMTGICLLQCTYF